MGLTTGCETSRLLSVKHAEPLTQMYERLTNRQGVHFWNPHDLLCESDVCSYEKDDQITYIDAGHLSQAASVSLYSDFWNFIDSHNLALPRRVDGIAMPPDQ